jgi:tRNA dimethylallyltransferase
VDTKNRRRLIRAIEIATLTHRPVPEQRRQWRGAESGIGFQPVNSKSSPGSPCHKDGVFVFRDRQELYQRINQRVEAMLQNGAIDEVRNAENMSPTAEQMIGVRDIRTYLAGESSLAECTDAIQQATRRYAKRQLTWFRHQTTFEPLNLSLLNHDEAVEWVVRQAVVRRAGE